MIRSDVFKEVKLEDLMTLDDIYSIKGLEDKRSSMRLIYNDQIIIGNGRHGFSVMIKNPLYHSRQ